MSTPEASQSALRGSTLADSARTMGRQAQTQLEALEPSLHQVDERVRSFAKERPLLAVTGALVGGFILGRVMAARRR